MADRRGQARPRTPRSGPRLAPFGAALALAGALLLGGGPMGGIGVAAASGEPAAVRLAPLALLARLTTAPERPGGYARSLFEHWIDADGDGCDTRREVLIAESLTAVAVGADCTISGGSWRSAYDGVRTTSSRTLDIDHVVPLKEAWDSGAWSWDPARRRAFANDLGDYRSLRAVSATSNRSKSDRDPAAWLPTVVAFRCTYAREWVAVKLRWSLSVDRAERAALSRLLRGCPAPLTSVAILAAGAIVGDGTGGGGGSTGGGGGGTTGDPSLGCDPNYAGWCVPISTTDLDCADVGHRVTVVGIDIHRLDGNGDGVGCESYPAG